MSDLDMGSGGRGQRMAAAKRLRGCLVVLVSLSIIVGLGVFAYVKGVDVIKRWVQSSSTQDYSGSGHGRVVVQVKSGDSATDIGSTLHKADVVKSVAAFTNAANGDSRSTSIQVGYYRMHRQMSGVRALQLMLDPSSRITTGVTIPEGRRAEEILALVAEHTRFTTAGMQKAFDDTSGLGLPPYAKGDAEGYLYPATYPVNPGTSPASLLKDMTKRFVQEANTLSLESGSAALHMSPTDVVIVASLVQAEARRPEDMPKVARVIYNRLKIGMALQLDSTLHYAVDSRGVIEAGKHLRELDTPYNSYTNTGLPPTPIDSPGELALKAALHPAPGSWRYFVTVNLRTGENKFATTYAQFLQYRQEYVTYCQTSKAC